MRLIDINHVKPGMVLARTIFHPTDGIVLLHQNVKLQEGYIKRLKDLQYTHLYIQEPGDTAEDLDILEPVKQETKIKASLVLKETLKAYEENHETGLEKLRNVVAEMIDQIYSNKEVVYNMMDIRSYDNYTYAHSVNVCTLALIMGSWLKLSRQDLETLGIGALLHDIGKIFVDREILNKPGPLQPEEYELVKTHTVKGYELLKEKISISFISAHIAYQHHERVDGSGYPRGLTHEKIHRFAKIVAV
ncbi:MAG TPA: HD domain-containing phosphohydrolase, partial [Bacillota bacterium]|nr:HD domain-containing phosphohydrolase [Bacillota bacterium]